MDKKQLRQQVKETLSSLSEEEKRLKTKKIQQHLFLLSAWKEAEVIGVTVSVGNEIDTYEIMERAWAEGKDVAVPKCFPNEKQLIFYKITSLDDLEESFYGLKEPQVERSTELMPEEISLLIVPGLIFDQKGYRVGYGGGYYDRFLNKFGTYFHTCSLCYDFQLSKELPVESHDIPVQTVVTDVKTLANLSD
ncbi:MULTISPECIES: 5-formyltetrahydrofolate cyclo-ligase [Bacillaceae]|uniref:5-formyltetrahydrofolate cyclo-ligase n=1 Tax=Evansella alkalicola TaxID=745819 RepID=A0ABS6K038_9BACI|nr:MULTISPECIES: 5-formyltetrahydrofolate cyclo-ligase [Bacillaceae]MBU9724217.1 5-formyltetrahydrofolate cyclo-ligase [Bacillus alkalicola]